MKDFFGAQDNKAISELETSNFSEDQEIVPEKAFEKNSILVNFTEDDDFKRRNT